MQLDSGKLGRILENAMVNGWLNKDMITIICKTEIYICKTENKMLFLKQNCEIYL